jgi:hypothetical protein
MRPNSHLPVAEIEKHRRRDLGRDLRAARARALARPTKTRAQAARRVLSAARRLVPQPGPALSRAE